MVEALTPNFFPYLILEEKSVFEVVVEWEDLPLTTGVDVYVVDRSLFDHLYFPAVLGQDNHCNSIVA